MRQLMTTFAAAAIGAATLLTVQPASAQVGVEVGGPGVGVRIGEPRYRDRDRQDRVRRYDDNRGDCRTVTVSREREDGSIVTRRERRCD
jgi:hypothetical protein